MDSIAIRDINKSFIHMKVHVAFINYSSLSTHSDRTGIITNHDSIFDIDQH